MLHTLDFLQEHRDVIHLSFGGEYLDLLLRQIVQSNDFEFRATEVVLFSRVDFIFKFVDRFRVSLQLHIFRL